MTRRELMDRALLISVAHAVASPALGTPQDDRGANKPPGKDEFAEFTGWLGRVQSPGGGALLVVEYKPQQPSSESLQGIALNGGKSPSLSRLATAAGRSVVAVGSVTTMVPRTAVTLNARLGEPDLAAGLQRDAFIYTLLSSLDEGQWRSVGSSSGLGMGDLPEELRTLFVASLPNPFVLLPAPEPKTGNPVRLTDAQLAQVRVRVQLSVDFLVTNPDGKTALIPSGGSPTAGGARREPLRVQRSTSPLRFSFGREVKTVGPSRRKPGDLILPESIGAVVIPLKGIGTVGEAVSAVAARTGLKLYADRRVASLRVWHRGHGAKAQDVLQALSLSVTGTYRKLGEAYVLTDDLLGVGTRVARIFEWQQHAVALNGRGGGSLTRLKERLRGVDWPSLFYPDRLANYEEVRRALREMGGTSGLTRPLQWEELPAPHRSLLTATLGYQPNRVQYQPQFTLAYVLPNGVEAEDEETLPLDLAPDAADPARAPKPVALNKYFKDTLLIVDPTVVASGEPDARSTLLEAIRRAGVGRVWLKCSWADPPDAVRDVARALDGGGIQVGLLVSALRLDNTHFPAVSGPGGVDGSDLDRNIRLETGAEFRNRASKTTLARTNKLFGEEVKKAGVWLSPCSPFALRSLPERLKALVRSVPGVCAVGLCDILPPGYGSRHEGHLYALTDGGDYGYTERMRSEFLDTAGVDPVDLVSFVSIRADLSLPLFPTGRERSLPRPSDLTAAVPAKASLEEKWNAFRYEKVEALVGVLDSALRDVGVDDLWLHSSKNAIMGWLLLRKGEGQKFHLTRSTELARRLLLPVAQQGAKQARLLVTAHEPGFVWQEPISPFQWDEFPEDLLDAERQNGWSGLAIDMSSLSLRSLLDQVDAFKTS